MFGVEDLNMVRRVMNATLHRAHQWRSAQSTEALLDDVTANLMGKHPRRHAVHGVPIPGQEAFFVG